jgi:hypothetical protein
METPETVFLKSILEHAFWWRDELCNALQRSSGRSSGHSFGLDKRSETTARLELDVFLRAAAGFYHGLGIARLIASSVHGRSPLADQLGENDYRCTGTRAKHAPKPTRASRVATGGGGAKSRALAQGACIMSDLSRSRRGGSPLPCSRCRTTMDEVLTSRRLQASLG